MADASKPRSILWDLLGVVVLVVAVLAGLYAYAGTWPPAVIVESSSMMHWGDDDVPYGNFGTLDPGDMVVMRDADASANLSTWAERDVHRYGDWGEVIVFRPEGDAVRTPIIHRAIAWVDVREDGAGGTEYWVRWSPDRPCPDEAEPREGGAHCVFGEGGITLPEVGLEGCANACGRDGYVTKGDNPVTNPEADQTAGIAGMVQPEWVVGKARGEIPWLGLVKLAVSPTPNEADPPPSYVRIGNAAAPPDLWVMLAVSLTVLIVAPIAADAGVDAVRRRLRERRQP